MFHKRIDDLSKRLQDLVHQLDNTDYNPKELGPAFLELEKKFNDLEEEMNKESGENDDD